VGRGFRGGECRRVRSRRVRPSSRRDLGEGLLASRLGPAGAPDRLQTPLALAWRLQRATLLAWSAALAVAGATLGSIAESIASLLEATPQLRAMVALLGGNRSLVDAYLAATMGMVGVLASAYAIQAVLRLRSEEDTHRAEVVLSGAVGRTRWAASHVVFAALGPAIALATAGVAAGLAHGLRTAEVGLQLPRVLAAALVQLPAAWVLAGLALALFGLAPRVAVSASWSALATFLLVGELGAPLQLSPRLLALSPFAHIPRLPGSDLSLLPLLALVAIAAVLAAAGLIGLRRRDIGGG
jgi:putative exporter of polyketide antibiotics